MDDTDLDRAALRLRLRAVQLLTSADEPFAEQLDSLLVELETAHGEDLKRIAFQLDQILVALAELKKLDGKPRSRN